MLLQPLAGTLAGEQALIRGQFPRHAFAVARGAGDSQLRGNRVPLERRHVGAFYAFAQREQPPEVGRTASLARLGGDQIPLRRLFRVLRQSASLIEFQPQIEHRLGIATLCGGMEPARRLVGVGHHPVTLLQQYGQVKGGIREARRSRALVPLSSRLRITGQGLSFIQQDAQVKGALGIAGFRTLAPQGSRMVGIATDPGGARLFQQWGRFGGLGHRDRLGVRIKTS